MNVLLTALIIWLVALPLAFSLVLLVSMGYYRTGGRRTASGRTASTGSSVHPR